MSGHLLGSMHLGAQYPGSRPINEYTAEELRGVCKVVCGYARDRDDALLLLTSLGLLEVMSGVGSG